MPEPPDAAALCLACGFCCDGVLHSYTVVQGDEVARMTAMGLAVEAIQGKQGFSQPCPLLQAGRCTAYGQRPLTCRAYQCSLLRRYLAGEIALEKCSRVIQTARKQLAWVRTQGVGAGSFMRWLKTVEQAGEATPGAANPDAARLIDTELLNVTLALAVYLHRYFGRPDS
jgi:Fe-S-cluster containining protein